MSSAVVVWLGGRSLRNFDTALKHGVWGFEEARPALAPLEEGDIVVFAEGFSGRQPRVGLEEWQAGSVRRLVVGSITRGMYRSSEPVWPDDTYEYRFDFRVLGSEKDVSLGPDSLPPPVADALRPVGTSTGRLVRLTAEELERVIECVDTSTVTPRPVSTDVAQSDEAASDPLPDADRTAPAVWWVNQGTSYKRERDGSYVWAPLITKAGTSVVHHANVGHLRPGDIVIHYRDSHIRALGRVCGYPTESINPTYSPESPWDKDGRRVAVDYFELADPIQLNEIELGRRASETQGPFDTAGAVKQGYMFPLSADFSEYARTALKGHWPTSSPWGERPAAYWLFQANPKYWSLSEWLSSSPIGTTDTWTASNYHAEMADGDRVVLWQAGTESGVYGLGRLTGVAKLEPTPDYLPQDKAEQWRVPFVLTRVPSSPLRRSDLMAHPVLKDLSVLKFANATNFKVTPEQWGAVLELMGDEQTDAKDPPTRAAVHLSGVITDLTPAAVQPFVTARGLRLNPSTIATAVSSLRAGKHLILTGPPGTGKTELALALAEAAANLAISGGTAPHTATADWTSIETVGGYRVLSDGNLAFRGGVVLDAIDQNQWLILDEFNRADIDKAIGQLFTVLSGQSVTLPFDQVRNGVEMPPSIVPANASPPAGTHPHHVDPRWRIIATLNSRDRDLLFSMSYALLRRFAVVDVPAPDPSTAAVIVSSKAPTGDQAADAAVTALASLPHRPMSPAMLIDCGRYIAERRVIDPSVSLSAVLKEALFAYVFPQLDDLSLPQLRDIVQYLHTNVLYLPSAREVARVVAEALLLSAADLVPTPAAPAVLSAQDEEQAESADPFEEETNEGELE